MRMSEKSCHLPRSLAKELILFGLAEYYLAVCILFRLNRLILIGNGDP